MLIAVTMKKTPLLLIVLLCSSLVSIAQSADEKAVAAAVENLRKAMLDGDKAKLEALAAPELTYGHSSGTLEDKAKFVDALASGKSDFSSINLTNQTIEVVGNVALVRHELHGQSDTGAVNIGILLVWKKDGKAWKLLARQAFKL